MPLEHSFESRELDRIRQALDEATPEAPEGRAMLHDFWAKHQTISVPTPLVRRPGAPAVGRRAVSIGAVAAFVLFGALLFPVIQSHQSPPPAAYAAAMGTMRTVTLHDGTRVVLAPASRIEVRGREVTLDGEAKFEVTHTAGIPFIVRNLATTTRRAVLTRVLGTEFAVRAYHDDATVRVAVANGRVAVQGVVANANTIVRVDATGVRSTVGAVTREAFAFANGSLVLTDVPLRDAASDIVRWFGLEIRFSDPAIGDYPISGTFTTSSAGSLAEILSHTLPVRVERQGRVLTLSPRVHSRGQRNVR